MNHFSLNLNAGSVWVLIVAIVAAFGFALWSYRHTIPKTTRSKRNILIALRTLGVASLLFAMFQPVFSSTSTTSQIPSIALALDNSQSMQLPQSIRDTLGHRRETMIQSIHAVFAPEFLADRAKSTLFSFGESTEILPVSGIIDSMHASASVTNISSVFRAVSDARKNKNIEAIVLYTDGAYTAGPDPIYAAQTLGVPVYAVGLGDSTEPRDVALTELFTNEVGTLGVPQPVDVTLHYGGIHAGEHVTVGLYLENEKLSEQSIALNNSTGDIPLSFTFLPKKEGIQKLTARVSTIEGETTTKNNVRLAYVNVLKNRFHIVLVAGAPSPDVSFVRTSLESNPAFTVSSFVEKEGADFFTPFTADSLKQTDLVVLIGFPVASTSQQSLDLVRKLIVDQSKPLLFIPSRELDWNKLGSLADALPFRIVAGNVNPANELKVSAFLNPSQADNPILHIPTEDRKSISWDALAPLFKTEQQVQARPESQTLAEATLQGIRLGEPLIVSREIGPVRQVALAGYGIWQWKLISYGRDLAYSAQGRSAKDSLPVTNALDLFLSNTTRWLTTQQENKRVQIAPSRKFYEAGETIDILGQVYDESYQPIDKADVSAQITGANLKEPIPLVLDDRGNGRYAVRLPQGLPAGDYICSGSASLHGNTLGKDQNRFNVGDFNIEFAEPRMRSDLLRDMAARTGGKFYTPQTASTLLNDILKSARFQPKETVQKKDFEIWNAWPLLFAAILFFASEWFMRKRLGML